MKLPRLFRRAQAFAAPPPQEGKKPTTTQLFDDTAIEQMVETLTSVPDPDRALEQAGLSRAELRRMEYDDEIAAAMETRLSAVQGTPWRLEPGEGQEVEFIWEQLEQVIEPLIEGAWEALPYGYSVMEAVYAKTPEGRIGIDRIEARPFEWFKPHPDGSLRYFPADGASEIAVDTRFKFFLTRRQATYSNPYGKAMLSRLFGAFILRQAGWRFWPQFLERFGAPLLVGKTAGDTGAMADALSKALQSAVVAVDENDDVTPVAAQGDGSAFERFELSVTKRIQKVILGQTLTTDVGNTGSYAAAQVHDGVRADRKHADIRMVARTVQTFVDALTELNWPGAEPPTFVLEDATGLQPERAERDSKLVQAGIIKLTDDYLLRAYDFEAGDFEIPESPNPQPGAQASASTLYGARFAAGDDEPGPFTPEQQAVEDLADDATRRARAPIPPKAIAAAIRAATGPEDLADRLAEVYQGNSPEEFNGILERALFAADMMGYVHGIETDPDAL